MTRLLLKFLPKTLISHADSIYRLWIVFYKISEEGCAVNLCCHPRLMTLCVGSCVECVRGYLLGFSNALLYSTRDPGGFTGFESCAIGDGTEHPKQPFSCFFVGVATADLVDVDSRSAETDGL